MSSGVLWVFFVFLGVLGRFRVFFSVFLVVLGVFLSVFGCF